MSSEAEGVPRHISRDSGVIRNTKAFFLKNSGNARFNICLLPALVTPVWISEPRQWVARLDGWLSGGGAPSTGEWNKERP